MNEEVLVIPFLSTFIFWLVGITSNWRRLVVSVLLSYAAIILASQYFDAVSNMLGNIFGSDLNANQKMAFGFGLCLVISLLGLYMLYNIMWKPTKAFQENQTGGVRFLQSIIFALIGWILGVLIAVCYFQYSNKIIQFSQLDVSSIWNVARRTINITIKFVSPWLVHEPPAFLIQLGNL
jgi:hypothetical protein